MALSLPFLGLLPKTERFDCTKFLSLHLRLTKTESTCTNRISSSSSFAVNLHGYAFCFCVCVSDILFQVHPEFHRLQQELSLGTYSSDSTIILGFLSIVALTASVVVGFCNVLLFTMGNLSLAVFSSEALIFTVLFFSPGDAVRLSCFPCWLWGCCFGPRLPSSFTVLAMYITT